MSKVFAARLSIYSIGLMISSAIERILTSNIVHITKGYIVSGSISYHVLSLVILIVLFILTNILLKPLTQKEFITQITLGNKEYIGGRWVEAVKTENNEISHITKIDITYDDDKINIHGDCYQNMQDKWQYKYCFDSICASMNSYELTYVFTSKEGGEERRKEIGQLRFPPNRRKRLNTYFGHFEDKGKKFRIAAILIMDKFIIKKMDNDFIGTAKQDVLPKLKKMLGLDVCEVTNNE